LSKWRLKIGPRKLRERDSKIVKHMHFTRFLWLNILTLGYSRRWHKVVVAARQAIAIDRLAGHFDNSLPESTITPSQVLKIWLLEIVFHHL
jgi:hypothetical protein